MGLEPGCHGLSGAVLEQIDRAVPVQIHHERAIGVAFPFRPIVEADGTRRWGLRRGETPHPAQEGIAAAGHPLTGQVPRPRRTPEG